MSTESTENLRCETRIDARIFVLVVRWRNTVELETSDVSFRGLFLRTQTPPDVRALLRLRVSLPTREITVHAMAVHVMLEATAGRGPGVGVQFWGLAGPERTAWDDFVRELVLAKRVADKKPREGAPT